MSGEDRNRPEPVIPGIDVYFRVAATPDVHIFLGTPFTGKVQDNKDVLAILCVFIVKPSIGSSW